VCVCYEICGSRYNLNIIPSCVNFLGLHLFYDDLLMVEGSDDMHIAKSLRIVHAPYQYYPYSKPILLRLLG
jgi:hypothetical protein